MIEWQKRHPTPCLTRTGFSLRWIAVVLAIEPELYDRTYGDTPLYRIWMDTYKRLLPWLKAALLPPDRP